MSRLILVILLIAFTIGGIYFIKNILVKDPPDEYYTTTPIFEDFDANRKERNK